VVARGRRRTPPRQRPRRRRVPAGEPLLRGRCARPCRAGRCARAAMARWGVGGAPARVRFTVSGERRSWARRVARIFAEPSGALAARQKNWRARGGCLRGEPIHALFAHGCSSCGRRSAAARPGAPLKNRPACAPQLCTVWRGRPVARAGSACVHVCSCPGNAIFEHVFRSCGCHRAAAGLGRSSKACTACAL
jgi:hypothetical protein